MRKIVIITGIVTAGLLLSSCRDKRSAGHVYMPDMAYSRAFETYDALDSSRFTSDTLERGGKIYYDRMPVAGTVAREDMPAFPLAMDKIGDTTAANYKASVNVPNPLPALSAVDYLEAARLYLINCGICHGEKLDGNGPLYNGGNGPYQAAPKDLIKDPVVGKMADGQMFYSITYGKNAMGSYASQLNTRQRWMIIHYIKEKQGLANSKPAAADSLATAKK
ncbi:MAG TPA: cytochrome c [Chitinophagaceae bacterium]|nr:cytochrome c [Chitinophagaceae bacterium]